MFLNSPIGEATIKYVHVCRKKEDFSQNDLTKDTYHDFSNLDDSYHQVQLAT